MIFFAVLILGARVTTLFTYMQTGNFLKLAHASQTKNTKATTIGKLDKLSIDKQKGSLKAVDKFDPFNMTAIQVLIAKMDQKTLELNEAKKGFEIMEKIKENKASEILASMDVEKASYLMTAMSKRRKVFKKGKPSKSIMKG